LTTDPSTNARLEASIVAVSTSLGCAGAGAPFAHCAWAASDEDCTAALKVL
jgi:hypothetical protein